MGSRMAVARGKTSPFQIIGLILDALEIWLARISSISILIIMLAVIADVIGRFLFNSPIPGVYELVELLMVAVVFLGLAYVQTKGRHVQMEFVINRFPGRLRHVMLALAMSASLWIVSLLAYKSLVLAFADWQMRTVKPGLIEFPMWPSEIMVPIGSAVLCLRFLYQLLHRDFVHDKKEEVIETDVQIAADNESARGE